VYKAKPQVTTSARNENLEL